MILKTHLLNLIVQQMKCMRDDYFRRNRYRLSADELIGLYVDVTGFVIDEGTYDEIAKQLEKEKGN